MKIGVITGTNFRHRVFLERVASNFSPEFVLFQPKNCSAEDREKDEADFFRYRCNVQLSDYPASLIATDVHSESVLTLIESCSVDYIFTFGCGLLRPAILDLPKFGCINMHTGIVDAYRGVDSAIWALAEQQFDKIGATVHYIDGTIDGGRIIRQERLSDVSICRYDSIYKVFLGCCELGFSLVDEILESMESALGPIPSKKGGRGKLIRTKDTTTSIIVAAEDNLAKFCSQLGSGVGSVKERADVNH